VAGQLYAAYVWNNPASGQAIGTFNDLYLGTYNPFPTVADGNPADHSLVATPFTTVIPGGADNDTPLTLTLATPQNYFGMEWLAVDGGNELTFYNQNNQVLATYTASQLDAALPSTYQYGSPYGQDYVYLNFYATNGDEISKIAWTESGSGGFEQTNDAVAEINPVPEPAGYALLGGGLAALVLLHRRDRRN
jgi:hypothetical protein